MQQAPSALASDPNDPGILEPVLTAFLGREVRVPHTDQAVNGQLANVVGSIVETDAKGRLSVLGHPIARVSSPNKDARDAVEAMADAASIGDEPALRAAAVNLMSILTGATQGRIYDGFAMLNYNRGAFVPDHVPGEYGASAATVLAMLDDPGTAPRGTWTQWADLMTDQRQLPPEAWDVLEAEGIPRGQFGSCRFVSVFANNEMYGEGPENERIRGWRQGDRFAVKLINLDNHTHYFRNVDFGPPLHDDIRSNFSAGSHSFEIMNFKPTYGAPKVAEMQWRAGWGFRPLWDVLQMYDVFPRASDGERLTHFFDGHRQQHRGYQYSAAARGGNFRFNPPPFIIGSVEHPSPDRLRDVDGVEGLVIGQLTEGFGEAKMCSHANHPLGEFCRTDISRFNPHGVRNVDTDGDGIPDVLWFPPFLRNPNPDAGGDIIPPTLAWKPFLWINPNNGTLLIDPADPSQGHWSDLTYAHGAPLAALSDLTAEIEAPRASAQVFYQFDDLFHDNAIFSPHPTFAPIGGVIRGDMNGDGAVNGADIDPFFLALGDPPAYAQRFPRIDPSVTGDINNDGALNGADIDAFFSLLGG